MATHRALKGFFSKIGQQNIWGQLVYKRSHKALKSINRGGKNLFQIVGVARSGTTLLSVGINSHPKALCLLEPYLSWFEQGHFSFSDVDSFSSEKWLKLNRRLPHESIKLLCRDSTYKSIGFKETFRGPNHVTFPTSNFLIKNAREMGVDKTIAIIRDPRDNWVSVTSRFDDTSENHIEDFTNTWNMFCQWVVDQDIFVIKYEQLVKDPERIYNNIMSYLDMEFNKITLHPYRTNGYGDIRAKEGGAVFTSSVGRYIKALNHQDTNYINDRCGGFMTEFSYR